MAREDINGISVPIPGTGEPADFVADLRRIATDLSAATATKVSGDLAATATPIGAAADAVMRAIESQVGQRRAAADVVNGRVPAPVAATPPTIDHKRAYGLSSVASIVSGGTGYAVGNTVTLAGGTFDVAAVLTITAVSGGAVTAVSVLRNGIYTANPSGTFTQGSTSGSGSGLQVTGSWGGMPTALSTAEGATVTATAGTLRFTGNGPANIASSGAYGNNSGVGTSSSWEWTTDATSVEIRMLAYNSEATLFVDDQRVRATPIVTDSSGGWWLVRLTFATQTSRRFRLFMGRNGALQGVRHSTAGGATLVAPTVTRALAWGLGDSYMEGSGASEVGLTSFMTMCQELGVDGLPDGIGGAGWDSSSAGSSLQRINNKLATLTRTPDIIVWDIGYNDSADPIPTVTTAMEAAIARAKELFPAAQHIAFSPAMPVGSTTALAALRDAMAAKFAEHGITMIDQTGWITAKNKALFTGADNVHPSAVGHAYLGARKAGGARPYLRVTA